MMHCPQSTATVADDRPLCIGASDSASSALSFSSLSLHACFLLKGPPNLGLSRQLTHSPQSACCRMVLRVAPSTAAGASSAGAAASSAVRCAACRFEDFS
eukprot:scaffold6622_cov50-Phaeocystis_antarctica.AAC.3